MSKEIPREELERNQLLQNAQSGDCFIYGDRLDTIWWKEINHEKLSSGEVGSGYLIDFVDGTQLKLEDDSYLLLERSSFFHYKASNTSIKFWF